MKRDDTVIAQSGIRFKKTNEYTIFSPSHFEDLAITVTGYFISDRNIGANIYKVLQVLYIPMYFHYN